MEIENKQQWSKLLAKARRGDCEAQYTAAYYYEEGLDDDQDAPIVKPNIERALHWYSKCAEQGDSCGQNALGCLMSSGNSIERDYKSAIAWTKKAIKQGDACAAHNLATIYRDLRKPDMAFKWYNRAYEMGHLDSLLQVGLCFCFGIGIKQNIKKASDCFKMIITDGKPPTGLSEYDLECAHYWNAVLQLLGVGGIKQSVTKARLSLELANEDNDNDQANELLNLIGKSEYTKV